MNPLIQALAALVEIPILIRRVLAEFQHGHFDDETIESMLEDELSNAA